MERAACALFGFATFGVHCTGSSVLSSPLSQLCTDFRHSEAYVEEPGEPMKLWIPRRSATKQTFVSHTTTSFAC